MYRIVIVGGGLAGLAAAWELTSTPGVAVTVLESTDRVGGKLRQEIIGGHLVDVGAESMLATRPEARALIAEIGAGHLIVAPATIADRATGAAEKFADAGLDYRHGFGLEDLGLA